MMKTFMMMAVFGIGSVSAAGAHASAITLHAVTIGSAQQEQEVSFPMGDDGQQGQTA